MNSLKMSFSTTSFSDRTYTDFVCDEQMDLATLFNLHFDAETLNGHEKDFSELRPFSRYEDTHEELIDIFADSNGKGLRVTCETVPKQLLSVPPSPPLSLADHQNLCSLPVKRPLESPSDGKLAAKREKNRLAAERYRQRKETTISALQKQVNELQAERDRLLAENKSLLEKLRIN